MSRRILQKTLHGIEIRNKPFPAHLMSCTRDAYDLYIRTHLPDDLFGAGVKKRPPFWLTGQDQQRTVDPAHIFGPQTHKRWKNVKRIGVDGFLRPIHSA